MGCHGGLWLITTSRAVRCMHLLIWWLAPRNSESGGVALQSAREGSWRLATHKIGRRTVGQPRQKCVRSPSSEGRKRYGNIIYQTTSFSKFDPIEFVFSDKFKFGSKYETRNSNSERKRLKHFSTVFYFFYILFRISWIRNFKSNLA
jgi:hypothetical protein